MSSTPHNPNDYSQDYTQPLQSPTPPPRPHTLAYTHLENTYDPNPYEPNLYEPNPYEPVEQQYPTPAEPAYPHEAARPAPAGLGPRASFDPGVDLPKFLGSAAATAAIAGILAYVGAVIIDAVATRWVGADYWIGHELAQPAADGVLWAWVAAAGAIIAAGVMWLLLKITNLAGSFFTALAALAVLAFGVIVLLNGPWQTTIGPAALGSIVIATIGVLTTGYTRLSVTGPDHY